MLATVLATSTDILSTTNQRAIFVAQNIECLQCHTEVLPALAQPSAHQPFLERQCTSCHNEHAVVVGVEVEEVTTTTEDGSTGVTATTWLRWGPFRWLAEQFEYTVLGEDEASTELARQEMIGEATLVADTKTLCWTCHQNLSAERALGFPHKPFAVNDCVSCHDPHASDFKPLLTASAEDLCVACHHMGEELSRSVLHPPAERRACLECHEPHASEFSGILTGSQRDVCFTCHAGVAGQSLMAVQHGPFAGDNCTGCHEPHGSNQERLLASETPQLCYGCHTTIEARYERASRHPVGTQLECGSCHDPHASNFDGLLVLAQRSLCLGCHSDVGSMTTMAVQHSPFAEEPCTGCHAPHGSDYAPLLRNPEPNLCYQCHPAVAVAMSRTSHHPEQCTRCHGVHASENETLLVAESGNSFCYRCHSTMGLTYIQSPHGVLECLECHNPHGSRFGALRAHAPTALCTGCHNSSVGAHVNYVGDGDASHRSTPHFYDVKAAEPLTCTSSCHNPHGSPYTYMMRDMEPHYDGTCLPCHAGVGKRF